MLLVEPLLDEVCVLETASLEPADPLFPSPRGLVLLPHLLPVDRRFPLLIIFCYNLVSRLKSLSFSLCSLDIFLMRNMGVSPSLSGFPSEHSLRKATVALATHVFLLSSWDSMSLVKRVRLCLSMEERLRERMRRKSVCLRYFICWSWRVEGEGDGE